MLRDVLLDMAAAEADVDGEHDTCAACASQTRSRARWANRADLEPITARAVAKGV